MNSTEIFSATTAAKELDNISPNTIESYVDALVKSNLIYMAYPKPGRPAPPDCHDVPAGVHQYAGDDQPPQGRHGGNMDLL